MNEIRRYLEERHSAARKGIERGKGAGIVRKVSSWEMRQSAKVKGTKLLYPWSKVKIKKLLEEGRPLQLHLGSGGHPLDGWVNVDIIGMGPDLYWDLRSGIPFPDGSASAVFLEHVCEHFTLTDDLDLLDECHRVLAPGGIVRIGVPDFGRYLESYAGDGAFVEEMRPGRPTRLIAVGEVALNHGHRSVWDAETLEAVLMSCGFVDARRRDWGDTDLDPPPDSEKRRPESVYAEARRP